MARQAKKFFRHPGEMVAFGEFHRAGDLQDVQDGMQGSLETPLRGDPKAEPWEQRETLEHKNKLAHFCASWVPIFSSDPTTVPVS
jgi:hypothetical protein